MTVKLCNRCRRIMQIDENCNKRLDAINCVFSSISNWDQFKSLGMEELKKFFIPCLFYSLKLSF